MHITENAEQASESYCEQPPIFTQKHRGQTFANLTNGRNQIISNPPMKLRTTTRIESNRRHNSSTTSKEITASQFDIEQPDEQMSQLNVLNKSDVKLSHFKQSTPSGYNRHHPTAITTDLKRQQVHRTPQPSLKSMVRSQRVTKPQVVISVSCSKAMTASDYKTLAKMVTKQRLKQVDAESHGVNSNGGEGDDSGKGYFSKQKMLESRIDKLRSAEARVKTETVCTKKNCPVALDQRTTQERYRNDPPSGIPVPVQPSKEVRERIERFRTASRQQQSQSSQKARKPKVERKEGKFNLNAGDRDIKPTATEEVAFNFMRRHQVVQETADIPLSELMRQNQERALRNMRKSHDKLRTKECQSSQQMSNTGYGSAAVMSAYPGASGNLLHNYKSHNQLRDGNVTPQDTETSQTMARTFATNMGQNSRNKQAQMGGTATSFARSRGHKSLSTLRNAFGSRNTLNVHNQTSQPLRQNKGGLRSYYGQKNGLTSAQSLKMVQSAYNELVQSADPELEHQDEFAATSLWQVAAKANQEDFREIFKNQAHQMSSEELEAKLVELISSQKHRPVSEPTTQVSPRTIKYLCNVITQDVISPKGANQPQGNYFSNTNNSTDRRSSLLASYSRKAAQKNDQGMKKGSVPSHQQSRLVQEQSRNQYGTQISNEQRSSYLRILEQTEERYDPQGQIADTCRPLLKDQKEKLVKLLTDKKKESQKSPRLGGEASCQSKREAQHPTAPNAFHFADNKTRKSIALVQQLTQELDASPTIKAKHKARTKNDIIAMTEKQFQSGVSRKATMFGRAMKIYEESKERSGVITDHIIKPDTMAHFHIEAFGDQIECNRYEQNRHNQQDIEIHQAETESLSKSFGGMPKSFRSSMDLPQQKHKEATVTRILLANVQKTGSDMNVNKTSCRPSSRSSNQESQDSVYSSMLSMRENLSHLMAESPEPPKGKQNKRLAALNRLINNPAGINQDNKNSKKDKLSVLLTKETQNELEYFQKMEIAELARLDKPTALQGYKALSIAQRPTFSGSCDHRINLLDFQKVQNLAGYGVENLRQAIDKGADLVEELLTTMDKLNHRKIFHGYWDQLDETRGCLPESRKGSTMNLIGNEIYVFGGFSRDTYNDLKVFDMGTTRWREVDTSTMRVIPDPRVSHTMVNYNDKMILFGGGGPYLANLHMMPSFNDIWMFETHNLMWTKLEGSGIPPKKRMYHTSAVFGSLMLIHGGYSSEGKIALSDFNLFDIEVHKWIKAKVIMNGKVVEAEAQYGSSIDYDDDVPRVQTIGSRMGHCMSSVYQNTRDRYQLIAAQNTTHSSQRTSRVVNQDQLFRGMWIHDRVFTREEIQKGRKFEEGIYMFGGQSRDEVNLNDLWLIKPEYYTNKRMIDEVKYQYTCKDPELTLNVQQITNFSGQPPCPRFGASMVHINTRKQGHQLLVVYGGRNDRIFDCTGSVGLNDVCIFNINLKQWESLAMFGQMPMSRWKHSMVAFGDQQSREGFLIFGGSNLNRYCKSKIFTFTLMNKKRDTPASPSKKDQAANQAMKLQSVMQQQKDLNGLEAYVSTAENQHAMNNSSQVQVGSFSQVIKQATQRDVRDDVSQKSAMRSKLTAQNLNAMVKFAPETNDKGQQSAQQTNQNKQQKQMLAKALNLSLANQTGLSSVPETTGVPHQTVIGKDTLKLNLGQQYTTFQESIANRLNMLKELLLKPKTEPQSEKKAKKQQ